MSKQGWQETLVTAQGDGIALASSTSITSIIPAAARYTLPANYFDYVGKAVRIKAMGRISTVTTTPGTLTFTVWLGTTASPIAAFASQALTLNIVAQTNAFWDLEILLTCRAIGNSTNANLMGIGRWISRATLGSAAVGTTEGVGVIGLPDTAPAVGTGFDSTVTNVLDLAATWSASSSSNSIQVHQYTVESLN